MDRTAGKEAIGASYCKGLEAVEHKLGPFGSLPLCLAYRCSGGQLEENPRCDSMVPSDARRMGGA